MTHSRILRYATLLAILTSGLCQCGQSMSDSGSLLHSEDAAVAPHADASADAPTDAANGHRPEATTGQGLADAAHRDAGHRDGAEGEAADGSVPGGDVPYDEHDASSCAHCTAYATPVAAGLVPAELLELSGLAASRRYPGRFYGHNDSGDSARIFALTDVEADGGASVTELRLEGATAEDWEDIAVGPCERTSCVFVADIGDNKLARSEYALYRLSEPETVTSGQAVTFERFAFVYPDGPHNAEALLIDPKTGRMFVVTKASDAQQVFEIPTPLDAGTTAVAVVSPLVRHLPTSPITGGAFHPCGDRLLLRTYGALFEYWRVGGAPLEPTFEDEPTSVPVAVELQGESVTYSADGLGYWTGSENIAAAPRAVLSSVRCQ